MALSGAALSAFAGRPLLALAAALSFDSVVFCLGAFSFGALSFPASSRAAAKSTTLPEGAGAGSLLSGVAVCLASLSGLSGSGAAGLGASGTVGSAFSAGAAFSAGGDAAVPSALRGIFSSSRLRRQGAVRQVPRQPEWDRAAGLPGVSPGGR